MKKLIIFVMIGSALKRIIKNNSSDAPIRSSCVPFPMTNSMSPFAKRNNPRQVPERRINPYSAW